MTSTATIVPPTTVTLRVTPGAVADFELWRWALSPVFEADVRSAETRGDFDFFSRSIICGGMSIDRSRASEAMRFRRGGREIARSGCDQIMVMTRDSDVELRTGRWEVRARAGDISLLDLTRPADLSVAAGANMTCMLPRRMLEPLLPTLDDLHGMIIPPSQTGSALLRAHLQLLLTHATQFSASQRQNVVQGLAHLLAACADPAADARPTADKAVVAVKFRQVRAAIDAHLGKRELGPEFLAKHLHVSRSSLYRMFEPAGGIVAHIRKRRLMRAHRDLTDPALFGLRINEIADRWGFAGHAVFSRAYRNHYGMQPSDARGHARHAFYDADRLCESGDESIKVLNRWLLDPVDA